MGGGYERKVLGAACMRVFHDKIAKFKNNTVITMSFVVPLPLCAYIFFFPSCS